jgi:transposase
MNCLCSCCDKHAIEGKNWGSEKKELFKEINQYKSQLKVKRQFGQKDIFEYKLEIDKLRAENATLREKLSYYVKKEKHGMFGLSTPSSLKPIKPNSKKEKKRKKSGAKFGHKGYGRKKRIPDKIEVLECPEKICPDCIIELEKIKSQSRTVIDMEPVKTKTIEYEIHQKICPKCKKTFSANVPNVMPRNLLSNNVLSHIAVSHFVHGIALGRILKQLNLDRSVVTGAMHRLADLFENVIERLKEEYRNALVKHADETGWKNNGDSGYAWVFCTLMVIIFLCRKTRAGTVVEEVFGKDPKKHIGVLVSDRYGAYNIAKCKRQFCYEHLKRDTLGLLDDFPDEEEIKTFVTIVVKLLRKAMRLRTKKITDETYYRCAKKLKSKIKEVMEEPANHSGIHYIQNIFINNENNLYQWVDDRSVPPDNNFGERTILFLTIARKVSFESHSERGAKTRSIMMSVLHTLEQRTENATDVFTNALNALVQNPELDTYDLLFKKTTEIENPNQMIRLKNEQKQNIDDDLPLVRYVPATPQFLDFDQPL